jgi:hypothetical protein
MTTEQTPQPVEAGAALTGPPTAGSEIETLVGALVAEGLPQ